MENEDKKLMDKIIKKGKETIHSILKSNKSDEEKQKLITELEGDITKKLKNKKMVAFAMSMILMASPFAYSLHKSIWSEKQVGVKASESIEDKANSTFYWFDINGVFTDSPYLNEIKANQEYADTDAMQTYGNTEEDRKARVLVFNALDDLVGGDDSYSINIKFPNQDEKVDIKFIREGSKTACFVVTDRRSGAGRIYRNGFFDGTKCAGGSEFFPKYFNLILNEHNNIIADKYIEEMKKDGKPTTRLGKNYGDEVISYLFSARKGTEDAKINSQGKSYIYLINPATLYFEKTEGYNEAGEKQAEEGYQMSVQNNPVRLKVYFTTDENGKTTITNCAYVSQEEDAEKELLTMDFSYQNQNTLNSEK